MKKWPRKGAWMGREMGRASCALGGRRRRRPRVLGARGQRNFQRLLAHLDVAAASAAVCCGVANFDDDRASARALARTIILNEPLYQIVGVCVVWLCEPDRPTIERLARTKAWPRLAG